MRCQANNFGRDTNRRHARWHILQDYCISSNTSPVSNFNSPENFCTRTNINMPANHGGAHSIASTNSYLLEDEAIGPNFSIRMYDNTVRMRQQ